MYLAAELAATTLLPELSLSSSNASNRVHIATGFALLQLQRGQILVAADDLSTAPDWQVQAYQLLKVLLPMSNGAVEPENLDYMIFAFVESVSSMRWDGCAAAAARDASLALQLKHACVAELCSLHASCESVVESASHLSPCELGFFVLSHLVHQAATSK